MDESLFLSEQNPESFRWVILEEDERSTWMYLTEPSSMKPVSSCWLYNTVSAPQAPDFGRGESPVVPATHATSCEPFQPPSAESVSFRWAKHGEAVAVHFGAELIGYISGTSCHGYSKHLRVGGPYGMPLDTKLYATLFGAA